MEEDALGKIEYRYDGAGNLYETEDSHGALTRYEYYGSEYAIHGLVKKRIDPLGKITKYIYDPFGNVTRVTDDQNQTITEYGYDVRGRMTRSKDARGNLTEYDYDTKNRLRKVTYVDGASETWSYNSADQLTETIDANGNRRKYYYSDGAGRLTDIFDVMEEGHERLSIHYEYDLMSNVKAETDAWGRTTDYTPSDMNLIKTITYPEAAPGRGRLIKEYGYDAVGNVIEMLDTAGHATQYEYDPDRRVQATRDPLGFITLSDHDVHDNLSKVLDSNGNLYEFVYDYHDRLQRITRDNGEKLRDYDYDLAGNLTRITDYDGTVTEYVYDGMNRLERVNYRVGMSDATSATFTYHGLSNLMRTARNDETGTITFTYNNRNRVETVTDVWGKQISYEYYPNGNRYRMTIGSRVTTYEYDPINRLTRMYDNAGNSAAYVYDDANQRVTRTLNNVLVTTYDYNDLDQLSNLNHSVGGISLANFAYGYESDLNVWSITDRNGTHSYVYDDKSQLRSATHSSLPSESFNYDGIGNHLNSGGSTPPPQHVAYQYDVNGDLKMRRDSAAITPVSKNIAYKYDALGRLVERNDGSQWTRYTYDGDDVVLDENSDGTVVVYGNGLGIDNKLWYIQGSASPVFFLADHLGSTRALVSSTGSIIPGTLIDYDSFGVPSTQIPTRFQYAGREYDPDTELYYYRARWYDPQARRFISEDPIGLDGGINLYAYVRNNPIYRVDPWGLQDILGIHSNVGPAAGFTDGHAWISYTDSTGNARYYGLWPDNHPAVVDNGPGSDVRIGMEDGQTPVASRYYNLNAEQVERLRQYINKSDEWGYTHTCANWASNAVKATMGEIVSAQDFLKIGTPRGLSSSILLLERVSPTSPTNPITVGNKSSSFYFVGF